MNSCELVGTVTAIACAMSKCYSKEELTHISAVLELLGETLEVILIQEELNDVSMDI